MRPAKRGMAVYMAILLLLLVSISLVTLGMAFGQDAKRTTALSDEAQLRQLLTAGAIAAVKGQNAVELPAELQARQAAVTVTRQGQTITIVATMGKRRMSQTLELSDAGDKPVAARLTE